MLPYNVFLGAELEIGLEPSCTNALARALIISIEKDTTWG
jgi:hypothetical protein